jgi:hypothetical protein
MTSAPRLQAPPRVAVALAGLVALLAPLSPASAAQDTDGPWQGARVGTAISYRVRQPMPMPGAPDKVAVITEEVTAATAGSVTVRITRREQGQPDRTQTVDRPRRMPGDQYAQFLKTIGDERRRVEVKVSGQAFDCRQHVREVDSEDRNPDHTVTTRTTVCRTLPGWIAAQRLSAPSWKTDQVRFELLEVRP